MLALAFLVVSQVPAWMLHEAYAANDMEAQPVPACYQVNFSRKTLAYTCITKAQWCRIHVAMGEFPHDECKVKQVYARCCG